MEFSYFICLDKHKVDLNTKPTFFLLINMVSYEYCLLFPVHLLPFYCKTSVICTLVSITMCGKLQFFKFFLRKKKLFICIAAFTNIVTKCFNRDSCYCILSMHAGQTCSITHMHICANRPSHCEWVNDGGLRVRWEDPWAQEQTITLWQCTSFHTCERRWRNCEHSAIHLNSIRLPSAGHCIGFF